MRSTIIIGMAVLLVSASAASARPGCGSGNNNILGSQRYSRGINAAAPSRDIFNRCSSNYDFGKNLRRKEKREYPNAVIQR